MSLRLTASTDLRTTSTFSSDIVHPSIPRRGTGHLELSAGDGHDAPQPHPESLLVLYLEDDDAVDAASARPGVDPIQPANRAGPSTE
jgi:hypothetical protein